MPPNVLAHYGRKELDPHPGNLTQRHHIENVNREDAGNKHHYGGNGQKDAIRNGVVVEGYAIFLLSGICAGVIETFYLNIL